MINFENDKNCGWTIPFLNRLNIKVLSKNLFADYLIIGAGFTGLSAARKLAQIEKNKKIIIVDAQLAGNGASSRKLNNSIETMFLMSDVENQIISSRFVKEIIELGGDVKKFTTKSIINALKDKYA